MKKEKKKKRISFKAFLFLALLIYLIGTGVYMVFTRPIKNIEVQGNKYVSTAEILKLSGLDQYPTIMQVSSLKINKLLKENKLINNAVVKKNFLGSVTLIITENRPLFINALNNELVVSSGETIANDGTYLGYPILVNYVPNNIYEDFIKGMNKIDEEIITKISEIEYAPDKNDTIVLDDARFLLRMNDTNKVYINTPNIGKLNNYNKIYAKVGGGGTLLLDSNSPNYIFNPNKGDTPTEGEVE
jgi:cell division protein FtsQ